MPHVFLKIATEDETPPPTNARGRRRRNDERASNEKNSRRVELAVAHLVAHDRKDRVGLARQDRRRRAPVQRSWDGRRGRCSCHGFEEHTAVAVSLCLSSLSSRAPASVAGWPAGQTLRRTKRTGAASRCCWFGGLLLVFGRLTKGEGERAMVGGRAQGGRTSGLRERESLLCALLFYRSFSKGVHYRLLRRTIATARALCFVCRDESQRGLLSCSPSLPPLLSLPREALLPLSP